MRIRPQTIASEIQRIAKKRGLSSGDLARLTGHEHHSYWSRVLSGKLEPGADIAQRAATALGEDLVRVVVFRADGAR
jgi:transcriptional regulator with XRE-family HTH domain